MVSVPSTIWNICIFIHREDIQWAHSMHAQQECNGLTAAGWTRPCSWVLLPVRRKQMRNPLSTICKFKHFVPQWLAEWLTLESFAHPIRTLHDALSSFSLLSLELSTIHMHASTQGSFTAVLCWLVSGKTSSLHAVCSFNSSSFDFTGFGWVFRENRLPKENKRGQATESTPLKI